MNYCLLLQPSHNRLYAAQSANMALAELDALQCARHAALPPITDLQLGTLDHAPVITFACADILPLLPWIRRLSATFLLFEKDAATLRPVPVSGLTPEQEDIVSIPKYQGKTNERFTRLMVNAALLASDFPQADAGTICLLDPLCGRGTTLFEGVLQGHMVCGIENDKKEVEWGAAYFEKYLQTKRYKHEYTRENITDQAGVIAQRHMFTFAPDKDAFKQHPQTLEWLRGDARQAARLCKRQKFHVVAADLPYGVHHGAAADSGSFTRDPTQLLQQALPGWISLMHDGGGMALSWNLHSCKRERMAQLLADGGLTVLDIPAAGYQHRVDQSILRDLIVARK